ncbi:MAG TPA: hypothetical protein VIV11_15920 [Kofleriaceae bacterium]
MMTADQAAQPHEDLIELEIGAFMGPHIKRARIALALVGILYAITSYLNYDEMVQWREWAASASASDPAIAAIKWKIDFSYFIVWFIGLSSIANIVLAAIAGKKPTFAIYTATGIFAVHTALVLWAIGALIVTSWIWWITLIVLGMGFQAAYKAQKLRKERRPAEARVVA